MADGSLTANDKPTPQYRDSIYCKCELASLTLEQAKTGRHMRQHQC